MSGEDAITLRLLRRWNSGDEAALGELLERHLDWVATYVHKRLGPALRSRDETVDFVQESMLDFLRAGPRVEVSDESAFRKLLARIAENNIRDRRRYHDRAKRGGGRVADGGASDSVLDLDVRRDVTRPSQHAQRAEHADLVRLALELLDPQDREVIQLRQFDELSFAEIGERMAIREDAARMRFQRALPRLAEKVAQLRERGLGPALGE
jgi:RNA polymerase sigma-70 factor (ECF subfamily)